MTSAATNKNGLLLLTVVVAFVVSRAFTLTIFPIFNDEAIYLQYSQSIHDDWQKNKFISMHGDWSDWKPPLQYWMAAPVIDYGNDPLVAGRAVSLFVSVLGLIGFYLFAKEFFGPREGLATAILYSVCPPVFFQNNQFTAETFLFSTAPFFYFALLRMMASKRWKLLWACVAIVVGMMLLLFKQSGSLLVIVALVLPLARLPSRGGNEKERRMGWRTLGLSCLSIAAVIVVCHVLCRLILPTEFEETRQQFNSRWVMSVKELIGFPVAVWRKNAGVVAEYIGAYYSWMVPVLVGAFACLAVYRWRVRELTLGLMCLISAIAVTFILRGFNEYIFNTAVIVALLPLLARTVVLVWEMNRSGGSRWIRMALLGCGIILLGHWSYQLALMFRSPGRYFERSTSWAVASYLKGWPTGFGMKEVVALLEKEKKPGVLFADTQWGNPLTTLQIYGRKRFPNLQIVPVSSEFLDPSETRELREKARAIGEVHLAIFSADPSDDRVQWQRNIEQEMCDSRQEIREYPGQMPIIFCRF